MAKGGHGSFMDQARTGSMADPKMARPEEWAEDKQGIPGDGLASRNRQRKEQVVQEVESRKREFLGCGTGRAEDFLKLV